MGPLVVIARDEGIEAGLLLQEVGRGGLDRFAFERQVHAFVPPVLLRVPRLDPLEVDTAVRKRFRTVIFEPFEDFVARLARDAKLSAETGPL